MELILCRYLKPGQIDSARKGKGLINVIDSVLIPFGYRNALMIDFFVDPSVGIWKRIMSLFDPSGQF